MTAPKLIIPKYVSLKSHPDINEKWLQDHISDNPELLGLGDGLVVRNVERTQPSGGRLDLLLEDSDLNRWYEVEMQLGSVDESHIIRTIEYWDIERRRYPQYDHTAVIVAENITGRFLNVISLFNGAIPMIAIQLKGVEVNGAFTLVATRVLDVVRLGVLEEPAGDPVDRKFWEEKSSADSMELVDKLVELVEQIEPGGGPQFTKHYVGLEYDGQSRNFVQFRPRQRFVTTEFKLPQEDENDKLIDDAGLDTLSYNVRLSSYRVRVRQNDIEDEKSRDALTELVRKARDAY